MAKRLKNAKRSNKPNPREYLNNKDDWRAERDRQLEMDERFAKRKVTILPRNVSQEDLWANLHDEQKDIVFAIGPAGCGKTLLSTHYAIQQYKAGAIKKIILTRPNIAVDDKDLGYLPGDILEKMAPWVAPFMDVFGEHYTKDQIKNMIEAGTVEIVPVAYMRGRTFKNSIVIVDEAQNTTPNSMLSILTRIGDGSKMIVTGDIAQSDRGRDNGLGDFLKRFKDSASIAVVQFSTKDVERHKVVMEVLEIYKDFSAL